MLSTVAWPDVIEGRNASTSARRSATVETRSSTSVGTEPRSPMATSSNAAARPEASMALARFRAELGSAPVRVATAQICSTCRAWCNSSLRPARITSSSAARRPLARSALSAIPRPASTPSTTNGASRMAASLVPTLMLASLSCWLVPCWQAPCWQALRASPPDHDLLDVAVFLVFAPQASLMSRSGAPGRDQSQGGARGGINRGSSKSAGKAPGRATPTQRLSAPTLRVT